VSPPAESAVLCIDHLSRNVNEAHLKEIFGEFVFIFPCTLFCCNLKVYCDDYIHSEDIKDSKIIFAFPWVFLVWLSPEWPLSVYDSNPFFSIQMSTVYIMVGANIYFCIYLQQSCVHDVPTLVWLNTLIFPLVASCGDDPVSIVIGQKTCWF
jgi:hypothetical protein